MLITLLLTLTAAQQPARDTTRLTLAQAIERALATHPSVGSARAAREGAAADLGRARSARLPTLTVDGSLNRFEEPMVVAPLHGFDPANPPLFDKTLLQSSLSLNWTVVDFGNRSSRVRAQRALDAAADAAVSSAELALVARVVDGYLRVLTTRGVLDAQDQRLTALAAESDRTRKLIAEGKGARIDGLRVDAERRRAEADRIASVAQLDVAEHELAILAQIPFESIHNTPLSALRLADTALVGDTTSAARTALVTRARGASTEIQERERRLQAAGALVAASRAAWFPELKVSGAYVDRGRWSGDYSAEWQVGVGVSYPLYTGGSRTSAKRRAQADDKVAAEQLRLAEQEIEQGVDRALAALREQHARVAALETAVAQSAEVVRIERLSLDVGAGTQTDYLDAEASLLSARASLIEARHAEISARVELARILGELSKDWLAHTVESSS